MPLHGLAAAKGEVVAMPLQLAYEEAGKGPPVVILHGLFGSSRNWRSVVRSLAASHRVLSVDLRNHGRSPWATSRTGCASRAARCNAACRSIWVRSIRRPSSMPRGRTTSSPGGADCHGIVNTGHGSGLTSAAKAKKRGPRTLASLFTNRGRAMLILERRKELSWAML